VPVGDVIFLLLVALSVAVFVAIAIRSRRQNQTVRSEDESFRDEGAQAGG